MSEPLYLGVDLGTSALKCGLWSADGRRAGFARVPYPTREAAGAAEQSAEEWWRSLAAGIAAAAEGLDPRRIEAVGVGGHAPSPAFVDAELAPVAPVMTWLDSRPTPYLNLLLGAVGAPPSSGPERLARHLAARALWLRDHAEGKLARARSVLHSGDFLAARLTGRVVTTGGPAASVFAAADLPSQLLPQRELAPGKTVGGVAPAPARALGLPSGVPVVAGGLDSFLGSVGSGICWPGDSCINSGSASVVALLGRPSTPGRFELAGLPLLSRPAAVGARTLGRAYGLTGSGRPFAGLLREAARRGPDGGTLDAAGIEEALPELARHGDPVETIRRVLGVICRAERALLEELEAAHGPVRRVRLVGGQAALPELGRWRAAVLGKRVEVPAETESGALGAALLAALATGRFAADPRTAAARMIRPGRRHDPDEGGLIGPPPGRSCRRSLRGGTRSPR